MFLILKSIVENLIANLKAQIGLLAGMEMIVEGVEGDQPEY
jgi:hypothetical protein